MSTLKVIYAKFNSNCSETGCKIKKGERMVYDYLNKKAYAIGSNTAIQFINGTDPDTKAAQDEVNVDNMIQANEDAYFDNFCYNNNI